jgi:hypothetical protein
LFLNVEILQLGFKSIDIASKEDGLCNKVQDVASAAHMTLRCKGFELFAEGLETRCIVRRIIRDEKAELVTDLELTNDFGDCS